MTELPIRCYGVAIVLIKIDGGTCEFLAVKRTRPPAGTWTYVAGGIEPGETAYQAATRETEEETGLEIVELYTSDLCEQFYEARKDSIWMAPVFVGLVQGAVILNDEHDEYRWCEIDDFIDLLTFPGAKRIAKEVNDFFVEQDPISYLRIDLG